MKNPDTRECMWIKGYSLIAVLLAAGMATGNGPEMTSMETEQGFDFTGRAIGVLRNSFGDKFEASVTCFGSILKIYTMDGANLRSVEEIKIIDEGKGKIRGRSILGVESSILGIYVQHGDYLIFAYQTESEGRPVAFHNLGHELLIVRRVKSCTLPESKGGGKRK